MSSSNRTTIADLPNSVHNRFAYDKHVHDTTIIPESIAIAPQTESLGVSNTYESKFTELLGLHGQSHYASFEPPPGYRPNRQLYSPYFLPTLLPGEDKNASISEHHMGKKILNERIPSEKEKGVMLNFIDEILCIKRLLIEIFARMGQYHKA